MEFNFERSVVFGGARRSADGKQVVIERAFHSKPVSVPVEFVQFIRTSRLRDMSLVVVDLGPLGELTGEVIIAAGRKDRFPVF
jgi:hypothetical protein